jgi:hypothetical protein
LTRATSEIGFKTRKKYEAAVLKACKDDENIRSLVISWLSGLENLLNEGRKN